jgi:hypothetical protein
MSDTSLSDRSIVRYPEVVAHMTTCATCKAAGSLNELTYNCGHPWPNGDRRCAVGRALDERHIADYCAMLDDVRRQIQPIIEKAAEALGVEACAIAEGIGLDADNER